MQHCQLNENFGFYIFDWLLCECVLFVLLVGVVGDKIFARVENICIEKMARIVEIGPDLYCAKL